MSLVWRTHLDIEGKYFIISYFSLFPPEDDSRVLTECLISGRLRWLVAGLKLSGERSRREARANWRLSWVVRKLRQWPPVWLTPTPAPPYQARSTLCLTSEKSKDPSKDFSLELCSGCESLESREEMWWTSGEEYSAGHSELPPARWRGGVWCSCRRGGRDHLLTGQGGARRLGWPLLK